MRHLSILLLLAALVLTAACNDNERTLDTRVADQALLERIQTVELRLVELEKQHAQDITALRSDLKNVLTYLETALDKLADQEKTFGQSADETLEKGLEELRQKTRDLLDTLQKELDEALKGPEPAPDGQKL